MAKGKIVAMKSNCQTCWRLAPLYRLHYIQKSSKNKIAIILLAIFLMSSAGCKLPPIADAESTLLAQTAQTRPARSQEPDSSSTEIPEEQQEYAILLDLDFADPQQLDYFSFQTQNVGDQVADETPLSIDPQTLLQNSALHIAFLNEQQKYTVVLSRPLAVGEGVYGQFILNQQTCFTIRLDGRTIVGFEGESYGSPNFFLRGTGSAFFLDYQGTIILHPDQWMSQFSWLEERQLLGRSNIVFNNIFWDPHNPAAYTITRMVIPDFDVENNALSIEICDDSPSGEISLDTFQIISGDPYAFLMDTSESYQKYPDRLYTFFNTFPSSESGGAQ